MRQVIWTDYSHVFFNVYSFIFEREREGSCMREKRGGAERGRERTPSRLQAARAELNAELDPMNCEIMT